MVLKEQLSCNKMASAKFKIMVMIFEHLKVDVTF